MVSVVIGQPSFPEKYKWRPIGKMNDLRRFTANVLTHIYIYIYIYVCVCVCVCVWRVWTPLTDWLTIILADRLEYVRPFLAGGGGKVGYFTPKAPRGLLPSKIQDVFRSYCKLIGRPLTIIHFSRKNYIVMLLRIITSNRII